MNEARALQDRLNQHRNQISIESLSKTFALRLLDVAPTAGVIDINDATLKELKKMYPSGKDTNEQVMLIGELPKVQPIIFESIDSTVMRAPIKTGGSALQHFSL